MSWRRRPLFDAVTRTNALPSAHSESTYAFLNRVAGDYWEQVRHLLQSWANNVEGPEDYEDLRARLSAHDDYQFRSAFLELYVHESLRAAGYALTVHPDLPGRTRKPDFLARRGDSIVYVEAIAPGPPDATRRASARSSSLFDAVDAVGDPNFYLEVTELRHGKSPARGARLRASLRGWLRTLDPDTISGFSDAPTFRWEDQGWAASFRALPRPAHARKTRPGDRSIGIYNHMKAAFIDDAPAVRKALAKKHGEYGDLGAPFVIVVGLSIFDSDLSHRTAALHGDVSHRVRWTAEGPEQVGSYRVPNGYFGTPSNWEHRQVSAVLTVNQLQPSTVLGAEATLWPHPDPRHPISAPLGIPCESMTLRGQELVRDPAPFSPARHFGLPDVWPEGEPFPRDY